MKEKTVFFGSGKFVFPIIKVLKNFGLAFVITTEKQGEFFEFCKKESIPCFSYNSLPKDSLLQKIREARPKLAVLASFGAIIPKEILNIFPLGIINIHPSLLPKYRGPSPVQAAILSGEKTTGVTIIKLDEMVDHGPILAQEKEKILPTDTAQSLYQRLFEKGALLLQTVLPKYLAGKITPKEQNHKEASFTKILKKEDGYISLSSPPEKEMLERMIRAYYPWPGVWTKIKKTDIPEAKLLVGKIIKLLPGGLIQVEGGKPMKLLDFQNGYGKEAESLLAALQL
jgi:methionyl-tRNA formyltransferase